MRSLLCLVLLTSASYAQDQMSPEEFETFSSGKTLYFSQDGQPYGAEQFFKNRRSLWMYSDGTCAEGRWFSDGPLICFSYEDAQDIQCWSMIKKGDGWAARPEGGTEVNDIDLSHRDEKPLNCPGPAVGV